MSNFNFLIDLLAITKYLIFELSISKIIINLTKYFE